MAIFVALVLLCLLILCGELFVRGIIRITSGFNLSAFVIGATIVAFGTVAPDFFFAVVSSYKGHYDVSMGSLTGSVIANILLCIGIASLISGVNFNNKDEHLKFNMRYHLAFIIIFSVVIFASNGDIGFIFALILLLNGIFFVIFNLRCINSDEVTQDLKSINSDCIIKEEKSYNLPVAISLVVFGLAGLYLSSHFLLQNLIEISQLFGIPKKVVSSTIISLGNSMPEIVCAILASLKKRSQIIIGNVVGSNILIFSGILGCSALVSNIFLGAPLTVILPFLTLDLPFLFLTSALFFILFIIKKQFGRIIGLIFIFIYLLYILLQINII
jgi:cation:H+ antiporter